MSITIPILRSETDCHQAGMVIDITSERVIAIGLEL